ncbi:ABC transporter substrate-binding protein [Cereibacter changlensis JA139]|uniref:ABC transporter substrate-binding protein n=2 Tax=Cereibacter changlensis TaxID=402884 RepID=A0A2T4JSZ0_9RHOB|nr:zinc ABC transporter substrate-binding protein AztC [Cereibacter changlensis]PTE21028.1 ABC transporter substrate-binding protein [Cereibacter changlensis JA139]PZX48276.1 zinc/manganese transport system substrate-binding protein [Cereibacter changlensis]
MKDWLTRIAAWSAIAISAGSALHAEPLKVVATFSILGDFAAEVGGERIALRTLVGPDSDAHVYEPRPSDAIALARADVILTNGLEFEGFMSRLIAASGTEAPITVLTEGVESMEEPGGGHYHYVDGRAIFHAGAHDPHAWQSATNAKVYVGNIAAAFCAADASGCQSYEANAAAYLADLDALDGEIRSAIAALPGDRRTVVVAHNAFRYFETAYGVTFLSPQGVSTESEAAAADVAGLIRQIRETGAGAIFAENISDTRLLEQIGREAGMALAGTLYSDALSGPEGPASTYLAMMRHNTAALATALAIQ